MCSEVVAGMALGLAVVSLADETLRLHERAMSRRWSTSVEAS